MKNNKSVKMWIVLGIAIIILGFISQVLPNIINKTKSTDTAEYGTLSVKDEAKALIIRKENVYVTQKDIVVKYLLDEGSLIKTNTKILEQRDANIKKEEEEKKSPLTEKLGDKITYIESDLSKEKGIFSTFVDGNENTVSIENYKNLSFDDLEKFEASVKDIKSETIKKDYPVYKMIDQSKWYVVSWIDNRKLSRYKVGQSVNIYFDSDEEKNGIKFVIEDISDAGKMSKILFSSNRYFKDFTKFRKQDIEIETISLNGIIIDNKNIVEKGNTSGVYVISKTGEQEFREIKILGSDGEKTAIKEDFYYNEEGKLIKTVKVFDEVVVKPKIKKEE